jgi:hypothetical protein
MQKRHRALNSPERQAGPQGLAELAGVGGGGIWFGFGFHGLTPSSKFKVQGSRFKVQSSKFKVQSLGFLSIRLLQNNL